MKITVFGSSKAEPGDALYTQSLQLGQMLAELNYEVITGGYMGTMEAVSRGAAESGGHVIGVTCQEIEVWRASKANRWVKEEWSVKTLTDRLSLLTKSCDAALALPGGIGTLVEICLTWNQMVIQSYPLKPLIVIGEGWKTMFESFFTALGEFTPESYRQWVLYAPDIQSAVKLLSQSL